MTRFRTGVLALAVLAPLVLAAPAGPATGTRWQAIPLTYRPGSDFRVLGFASGRVWIETGGERFTLLSATIAGGRVGGFVRTTIAGVNPWLLGNQVVYQPGTSGSEPSVLAPLLANGHVGAASPLPGDPETAALKVIPGGSARAEAALTVHGHTIWALEGGVTKSVDGGLASLVLCCTASGDPADLTALLTSRQQGIFPFSLALGLDAQSRLWLAWADSKHNISVDPNLTAHLVQLDPTALTGVTANTVSPVNAPTFVVCAETCRIVFGSTVGTFAWRGVGTAALILPKLGSVLAADVRAGRLELLTQDQQQLVLRRGAPTGTGLRVVASVAISKGLGSPNDTYHPFSQPAALGTPFGVVAIQPFVDFRDRSRVYATVFR